MPLSAALRDALEQYRASEKDVVAIGSRSDEGRKLALVNARRALSEKIGVLGLLIERDTDLAEDSVSKREFSQLFTAMRYSLALHQASWPVVRIDENPGDYLASAREAQSKSNALWHWSRSNLGLDPDGRLV